MGKNSKRFIKVCHSVSDLQNQSYQKFTRNGESRNVVLSKMDLAQYEHRDDHFDHASQRRTMAAEIYSIDLLTHFISDICSRRNTVR